jgi:hypothetical protein
MCTDPCIGCAIVCVALASPIIVPTIALALEGLAAALPSRRVRNLDDRSESCAGGCVMVPR